MAFITENKFVQFITPLGKDAFVVQDFEGDEGVSRLFRFHVGLVSDKPDISFDALIGQEAVITLDLADGTRRYFHGVVSKFYQEGSDARFTFYRAELVPWLWILTRAADCRIFQNMTVPDIIKKVFSDLKFKDFKDGLEGSFTERIYCVQYRETDFNFVSRLMEEEGICYFFEHEEKKHTLVMANSPAAHKPCPKQENARCQAVGGSWVDEDVITSWMLAQEFSAGKYSLADYNFETPDANLGVSVAGKSTYEIYDYPGGYGKRDEGDRLARIRLEAGETPQIAGSGSSTCRAFTSGYRFDLEDHYRDDMNKAYVLTAVHHTGDDEEYSNTFECIPHDVPFRPSKITPKPIVQGSQTAVVVGKSGEEIWVDKYGRVQVQFHWDREGKNDENSSCLVRVAQNWAGKRFGIHFHPRVGDEVIVNFLEGDPDQPIITGSVYNARQMPPYDLPGEDTKSTIKSSSSKGGGGSNEIRFEDKADEEEIYIHAQKDYSIVVENDLTKQVANDETNTIMQNRETTIEEGNDDLIVEQGNRTISVNTGDEEHEVKGNRDLTISGDESHTNDADYTQEISGDHSETVSGNYTLKVSGDITIEADGNITIKGSLIKLN